MSSFENKIPPPLIMVIFGFLMWAVAETGLSFSLNDLFGRIVVALLVLSGMFFTVGAVGSFKAARTTIDPLRPEKASSLVSSGVYRVTRNPMYLGLTILLLAWGIHLESFLALLFVPGFMLYITRFQIIPEERALEAVFGEKFERYKLEVRRWL